MHKPSIFWVALTTITIAVCGINRAEAANTARPTLAGVASVIDGDTLEVHGTRIRLWGLDAPEAQQHCQRADGRAWRCGSEAANRLADLIGRRPVTCSQKGVDRYKRVIAACVVGGTDINGWLVANGWALAYTRYSKAYVRLESRARQARAGIHEGAFTPPWEYRASRR